MRLDVRMERHAETIWGSLISAGVGILIGFFLNDDTEPWVIILAAVILIAAATAVLILSSLTRRRSWLARFEHKESRVAEADGLRGRWLNAHELHLIPPLAARRGLDHRGFPDPTRLAERLKQNPKLVFGNLNKHNELVTCMILYPLRATALQRYVSGEWLHALALTPQDLAPSWHAAHGVYIALILADVDEGGLAKGSLRRFLQSAPRMWVFARAASPRGRALLERFGFTLSESATSEDPLYGLDRTPR